jgi:hypothetical protein
LALAARGRLRRQRSPIIARTEPAGATKALSNQAVYLQDGWLSLSKFQPEDE